MEAPGGPVSMEDPMKLLNERHVLPYGVSRSMPWLEYRYAVWLLPMSIDRTANMARTDRRMGPLERSDAL